MTKSQKFIHDTYEERLKELIEIGKRIKSIRQLAAKTSDPELRDQLEELERELGDYARDVSRDGVELLQRVA